MTKPTDKNPPVSEEEAARFRKELEIGLAARQATKVPFEQRSEEEQQRARDALMKALNTLGEHHDGAGYSWEETEKIIAEEIAEVRRLRAEKEQVAAKGKNDEKK